MWGCESSALVAGPPSNAGCQLSEGEKNVPPEPATVLSKPYDWVKLVNPVSPPERSTARARKKPAVPERASLKWAVGPSEKTFFSCSHRPSTVEVFSTVTTPLVNALVTIDVPALAKELMRRSPP